MVRILRSGSAIAPGDIRVMGAGDKIIILRSEVSGEAWPSLWEACGVAVRRGAELRVTDLKVVGNA